MNIELYNGNFVESKRGKVEINRSLIDELADGLYPSPLDCFREFIANSWDAYSPLVKIDIDMETDSITIEDWGIGIEDVPQFWEVGSPLKKEWNKINFGEGPRYVIGSKGLGKLAHKKIGNKVELLTRTENRGFYSTVDPDLLEYVVKEYHELDDALPHSGTRFEITELVADLYPKDVYKYIEDNLYGLILPIISNYTMKIFVNEAEVTPKIPGGEGVKQFHIDTKYGKIHGYLEASNSSSIDVLCRGPKIREVNPSPDHPCRGFVIVNWLNPTTNRHDFVRDRDRQGNKVKGFYDIFYNSLKKYTVENFPSQLEVISTRKKKAMRRLVRLLGTVIEEMGIYPINTFPSGIEEAKQKKKKNKPKESPVPQVPGVIKHPENIDPIQKFKPIKTKYGIKWSQGHFGENPAVLADLDSKTIYFNLDNSYFSGLDGLKPQQQIISMVPLFARGIVSMLDEYKTLPEFQTMVDDVSARLLLKLLKRI